MPATTINPDDVCKLEDLEKEIGGAPALTNLGKSEVAQASIASTLDEVVFALFNRVPPVLQSDLADVTELKLCVLYGSLARLYVQNITTGDSEDVNARKAKIYGDKYDAALAALRPTLNTGEVAESEGDSVVVSNPARGW